MAAGSPDTAADKVAAQPKNRLALGLESLTWTLITGAIIWYSDLVPVLLYNQRVYRTVLYFAALLAAIWVGILLFVTFYVRLRVGPDGDWTKWSPKLVPVATLCMVGAFILTCVAIWPVFHILTLPLLLVASFFVINAISLTPSVLLCTEPAPLVF